MSDALYPIERAANSPTGKLRPGSILATQLRRKPFLKENTIHIAVTINGLHGGKVEFHQPDRFVVSVAGCAWKRA